MRDLASLLALLLLTIVAVVGVAVMVAMLPFVGVFVVAQNVMRQVFGGFERIVRKNPLFSS